MKPYLVYVGCFVMLCCAVGCALEFDVANLDAPVPTPPELVEEPGVEPVPDMIELDCDEPGEFCFLVIQDVADNEGLTASVGEDDYQGAEIDYVQITKGPDTDAAGQSAFVLDVIDYKPSFCAEDEFDDDGDDINCNRDGILGDEFDRDTVYFDFSAFEMCTQEEREIESHTLLHLAGGHIVAVMGIFNGEEGEFVEIESGDMIEVGEAGPDLCGDTPNPPYVDDTVNVYVSKNIEMPETWMQLAPMGMSTAGRQMFQVP